MKNYKEYYKDHYLCNVVFQLLPHTFGLNIWVDAGLTWISFNARMN